PGPGPALLGARLTRARPPIRGDEVTHGAGLVREVRGDERPLRRVGRRAEHVVPSRGLDDTTVFVLLIGEQGAVVVPHRNARRGTAALSHEDEPDPVGLESLRLSDDGWQRVV